MPSTARNQQPSHVALMRGINVGGRNMLPMKDLVAMFLKAGCEEARAYIQSGNVVFRAPRALVAKLPAKIQKAVSDRFGFSVPVVIRTAAELRQVAEGNPFLKGSKDLKALHVAFLADRPAAAKVAGLDPARSPPDRFAVKGGEIFLHCPNGVARTKLSTQYFDSKLSTVSTLRNWNTVLKLVELAEA